MAAIAADDDLPSLITWPPEYTVEELTYESRWIADHRDEAQAIVDHCTQTLSDAWRLLDELYAPEDKYTRFATEFENLRLFIKRMDCTASQWLIQSTHTTSHFLMSERPTLVKRCPLILCELVARDFVIKSGEF